MFLPPTPWMEQIVRIDSTTHRTNEEVVRFLHPLLEECGLKVEEQKVIEDGQPFYNLVGYSHDASAPDQIALSTHLDTVSYGNKADWTKTAGDPFRATRVRDRLYGLGTADVKIDFLCKLWAARLARPWKRPFALVGTFGEERGLVGVRALLANSRFRPKQVLVGEPSDLELIYAHKGHLVFHYSLRLETGTHSKTLKKEWRGRSAHSSTPQLGENALLKALNDILKRGYGILSLNAGLDANRLPDFCQAELSPEQNESTKKIFSLLQFLEDLSRDLKKRKDTRFSPPFTTLSLNRAHTEGGMLQLTFDLRPLPDANVDKLIEKLNARAKALGFQVGQVSVDEPLRGQKNGRFITLASQVLKEGGIKVQKKTKASSTEAAVYQKFGADAIVFGPGPSHGNVHRPNEYNSFRQIAAATKFYAAMLKLEPVA